MPNPFLRLLCSLVVAVSLAAGAGATSRLKELATLEGVRDNQLLGYGLVVGLAGTGDKRQTIFSAQTLANLLERMGVSVDPSSMLVRNTAAVMVTGTLPPFAQAGNRIGNLDLAVVVDVEGVEAGWAELAGEEVVEGVDRVCDLQRTVGVGVSAGDSSGEGAL